MRRIAAALLAASLASLFSSCADPSGGRAVVWTDVPELAIAVELFDALPAGGGLEVDWKPDLPEALRSAKGPPALAIGRYLGSAGSRSLFASLDYLLRAGGVNGKSFYPELLAAGVLGGKRILLPVSFNLPLIAFARDSPAIGDGFTLSLAEMSAPAAAYNRMELGAYTRMGFSPRWDGSFLIAALESGGASFAEGKDQSWSARGLEPALGEITAWVSRANGSASLEDDFQFKYLFAPPYRFAREGRALFASLDSSAFFLAPEESRAALDFRWFARDGRVRISDGAVFAGILRGAKGRAKAESFLRWLLGPEAQRAVLERSRRSRATDFSFGVAGGFSSLRSVNEEIFPSFFPALVGHAPPAAAIVAPPALPQDWPALVSAVLAPWAIEATSNPDPAAVAARLAELPGRVVDYRRLK